MASQCQEAECRSRFARDEGAAEGYGGLSVVGLFEEYHGQCGSLQSTRANVTH